MLLGVREVDGKGAVLGVNRNSVSAIRKNFINMLNNPNKMAPSLYLSLEEFEIDGKLILWVYVPISSQVEFCDKRIWDRNGDADQDITNSVDLVANLFSRKSASYHERKIFHTRRRSICGWICCLVSVKWPFRGGRIIRGRTWTIWSCFEMPDCTRITF